MTKQEQMFSMVEKWEKSNASVQDFCSEEQISYPCFYYWRKKYDAIIAEDESHTFHRIEPELPDSVFSDSIEIQFPNGVKISVPKQTPISTIQALIQQS